MCKTFLQSLTKQPCSSCQILSWGVTRDTILGLLWVFVQAITNGVTFYQKKKKSGLASLPSSGKGHVSHKCQSDRERISVTGSRTRGPLPAHTPCLRPREFQGFRKKNGSFSGLTMGTFQMSMSSRSDTKKCLGLMCFSFPQ